MRPGGLRLLWPRWREAVNSFDRRFLLTRGPLALVALATWWVVYFGTYRLLTFIQEIEPLGNLIAIKLMGLVFFMLLGFLFLSNLVTSISAFYLSRDLPMLLARPVELDDILVYKAVESWLNSSWMVAAYTPAVLIAYGRAFGLGPGYYLWSHLLLIPFLIIPAGVASTLAHLAARFVPVRLLRRAFILLAIGAVLGVYLLSQNAAGENHTTGGLLDSITGIRTDSPLLPGFWMTEALGPMLWGEDAMALYPTLLVTNAVFWAMMGHQTGQWFYGLNLLGLWGRGSENRGPVAGMGAIRPGWEHLWKDMRVFSRDTEQWSQLLMTGALLFIYAYNFKAVPIRDLAWLTPYYNEMAMGINVLLGGMVLAAVAARFAYVSVSLEGGCFWVLKAAPVDMRRVLLNKYAMVGLPISFIVTGLVSLSSLLMQGGYTILSALTVGMLSLSVCAMALGLGARYPRFNYESVAQVAMGMGSITFMALAFALVLVTVGIEGLGVYLLKRADLIGRGPTQSEMAAIAGLGLLAVGLNLLAAWIPLKLGLKRLRGDHSG